ELFMRTLNQWVAQNPQVSTRMYHSTAALLPSAKVVSAGSDIRTWDYEVFSPGYIACDQVRPGHNGTVPTQLNWATQYTISVQTLPPSTTIDHVVLMRPCATTHNFDMDQRYVDLEITGSGGNPNPYVTIKTPTQPNTLGTTQGSIAAPPG